MSTRIQPSRSSGGGMYVPAVSPKLIESWLSYLGMTDDGAGLISAWTGQIAGHILTAAAAARATLTAAQFGAQPGLILDGVANAYACTTIGADIVGETGLTILFVYTQMPAGFGVLMEYGSSYSGGAGRFGLFRDSLAASSVGVYANGDVGASEFDSNAATVVAGAFPGIIGANVDFTLATNESSAKLDGGALGGGYLANANNTAAMANQTLYVGGRGAAGLFADFTLGAINVYQTLTAGEQTTEVGKLRAIYGTP